MLKLILSLKKKQVIIFYHELILKGYRKIVWKDIKRPILQLLKTKAG